MIPHRSRAACVALALLASACGSARRSEPEAGRIKLDSPAELRGQQAFHRFCSQCHPGGEGGLGPALNNKPLPGAAIKIQVRNGVGEMPAFADTIIPDPELDAIIDYMQALRAHGD